MLNAQVIIIKNTPPKNKIGSIFVKAQCLMIGIKLFIKSINCHKGCDMKGQATIKEMVKEEDGRLRKTSDKVTFKLIPKEQIRISQAVRNREREHFSLTEEHIKLF